ncbi:MAG: hypothetical protein GY749_00985 [Desulfobacteraceae bacterium]|nr:hypothetical protein [Desulfobacteraceae bacterium]
MTILNIPFLSDAELIETARKFLEKHNADSVPTDIEKILIITDLGEALNLADSSRNSVFQGFRTESPGTSCGLRAEMCCVILSHTRENGQIFN